MSLDTAISNLVNRLETVTARLAKVEGQLAAGSAGGAAPAAAAAAGGAAAGGAGAAWIGDYDNLISEHVSALQAATAKIGNDQLKTQVGQFAEAVAAQRAFLNVVATSKEAPADVLAKLLAPTSAAVGAVIATRDSNRGNEQWNHLSTLSEFAPGFGWVGVSPTPAPFLKDFVGNAQFYSNKLLREYKGKDEDQVAWVNAINGFGTGLQKFIRDHHTTGLKWNPKGGDAASASPAPAAAPKAAGGPPPPMPTEPLADKPTKSSGGAAAGLFAELSKGADVTKGLKKVTKDMKTKNRTDKSAVVPAVTKKPVTKAKAFGAAVKKGTPKFELSGNKWVVDWQENNNNIVIEDCEVKHTVYVYKCSNSVVQIKGKVNAVTLDGCKKVGLVFQDVIASVEMVNCNSVEVQAIGKVPSFAVDKCSGVQLILSSECLDAEVVSSKSDQMNIVLPPLKEGDDITEMAIPEQFKTVIQDRKLVTNHVEHV